MKNRITVICLLIICSVYSSRAIAEELNTAAGAKQSTDIDKKLLDIERQQLELEKQKLLFEREKLNFDKRQLNPAKNKSELEENDDKAGVHKHDGFFLRLAGGIGSYSTYEESQGTKYDSIGESGLFNFAIGGAIAENLILHLDLNGLSSSKPKVKINGTERNVGDLTSSASILGIGLTYYFPANIYLTGSLGVAELTNKINGTEYKTKKGFGSNIMLGKEWWISDNWGLGLAGQFMYASCPDESDNGVTPYVHAKSFGVLLSATYN